MFKIVEEFDESLPRAKEIEMTSIEKTKKEIEYERIIYIYLKSGKCDIFSIKSKTKEEMGFFDMNEISHWFQFLKRETHRYNYENG